jgi:uncharacterized damage-inducible protein DinB
MTYYGGKEMAASFRTVRNNTIRIAEEIPEEQYRFKPAPETRSVGELLVHLALGPGYQYYMHSHKIDDLKNVDFSQLASRFRAEEAKTRNKAETIAFLRSEGETFAAFLEGLTEPFLAEQVRMPPGAEPATKSRLEMLLSPKEHEMHHRGQLMTIERMLGLVPHLTRQMQERMAQQAQAQAAR